MTFEPGQTIDGRYLVKQRLGGNSHGSSCKAITISNDKEVVLKKLHHDSDHGMQQQLHLAQQAQLLSRQCDELLTIEEVSVEEDDAFYVMPFLPARSLKRRESPAVDSKIENSGDRYFVEDFSWLDRIAKALDFLADHHHIHGDVKPTNVLFAEDNKGLLKAYLNDIEIAKPLSEGDKNRNKDEYPGTMAYLAKEVFLNKNNASHYSDQFALAVTLYQWLSGKLPFKGVTGIEMYKAFQEGCEPIAELCPDLPQPACEAIQRALADEPVQRFGSSGEFAAAFLASLPVRAKSWWESDKLKFASNIFLAIAASILLFVVARHFLKPDDPGTVSENGTETAGTVEKQELTNKVLPKITLQKDGDPPEDDQPATPPSKKTSKPPAPGPAISLDPAPANTGDERAAEMPDTNQQPTPSPKTLADPSRDSKRPGTDPPSQLENEQPTERPAQPTRKQVFESTLNAAKQPSANAAIQFKLAKMYEQGNGTDADNVLALKWYEKSAEQGSADAQIRLGNYYERKANLSRDQSMAQKNFNVAIEYYKKAAYQGRPDSSRILAEIYENYQMSDKAKQWSQTARQQEQKLEQKRQEIERRNELFRIPQRRETNSPAGDGPARGNERL